jgi:hypothetical protein
MLDPKNINMEVFERRNEHTSAFGKLIRFITTGTVFDVNVFIDAMRANIGDLTFQVCGKISKLKI